MSFQKRNAPIVSARVPSFVKSTLTSSSPVSPVSKFRRPSTLVPSYITHSTGTSSLDRLLLHDGLPLGTSLLVFESGSTDFASVIARCYAAQGVANGDTVVAIGTHARWGHELPAPADPASKSSKRRAPSNNLNLSSLVPGGPSEKEMKIAWRYRHQPVQSWQAPHQETEYCRSWNLTLRVTPPAKIQYIDATATSFDGILNRLSEIAAASASTGTVTRVVLPGFLNPTTYPLATAFQPDNLLQFLHRLRALLRKYASTLSVLFTLSASLFDASLGNSILIPWIETLVDGVVRLVPVAETNSSNNNNNNNNNSNSKSDKDRHQGFIHVLKLPVVSDRGSMAVKEMEYSFKVGKGGMIIEKWGIPVIIDEKSQDKKDELEF
ncbi:Elongator complex protein 4 [Lipomyces japonicus]|uniref:Elongator complex protein 4 n=1 Tax=Lipomyces japonicus TaxID=56871 RepID=UPI0034CFA6FB